MVLRWVAVAIEGARERSPAMVKALRLDFELLRTSALETVRELPKKRKEKKSDVGITDAI